MAEKEVKVRWSVRFREQGIPEKKVIYDHQDNAVFAIDYDEQGRPLNGVCGDFMTWRMEDMNTIVISGDGDMDDFTWDSPPPWFEHEIKAVIVEEGVRSIGCHAFTSVQTDMHVEKVIFPESLCMIESSAFSGSGLAPEILAPYCLGYE